MKMDTLETTTFLLAAVGGLNYGLIGFFKFDLLSTLFTSTSLLKIVLTLIGLSALYTLYNLVTTTNLEK